MFNNDLFRHTAQEFVGKEQLSLQYLYQNNIFYLFFLI